MNKAVFLDRDGTINREVDYLSSVDEFEFLEGAIDALRALSKTDYKIIIITNQSGVARGYFTPGRLEEIHQKMLSDLRDAGARIDAIYYCPHHPDEGCSCRKPSTGLIEKARREYDLDLKRSFMVGDTTGDIKTGMNAGLRTILVDTGYSGKDGKFTVEPDYMVKDLSEAVRIIQNEGNG